MQLTLKVLNCRGRPAPEQSVRFDQRSGTIGRSPDNDLVLPDPENFISRRHAEIKYERGSYILTDTSLSGTVIDDCEPLIKSSSMLRDGMRIQIGDYELGVEIEDADDEEPISHDSFSSDDQLTEIFSPLGYSPRDPAQPRDFFANFEEPQPQHLAQEPAPALPSLDDEQPESAESLLAPFAAAIPARASSVSDPADESLASDSSVIPADSGPDEWPDHPPSPPIDADLDPDSKTEPMNLDPISEPNPSLSVSPAESGGQIASEFRDAPAKVEVAVPPLDRLAQEAPETNIRSGDVLFKVLLDSMGIDDPRVLKGANEEAMVRLIGEMLVSLIEGMMILLRNRAESKNRFRLPVTMIRPVENNPLKFSVSVTDAVTALLKPGHKGYLNPIDAIRSAIDDLCSHELAMASGTRSSLIDLLSKFDPDQFEKQSSGGFFKNNDAKCWQTYSSAYKELVHEAVDGFFGEAFAMAYEEQVEASKSTEREK
jgi:type VI secretion system protein